MVDPEIYTSEAEEASPPEGPHAEAADVPPLLPSHTEPIDVKAVTAEYWRQRKEAEEESGPEGLERWRKKIHATARLAVTNLLISTTSDERRVKVAQGLIEELNSFVSPVLWNSFVRLMTYALSFASVGRAVLSMHPMGSR